MNTVTFTCKIITPMFLAGADGATPEIRPQSIKGALRFWWRALHGHLPIEDVKDENHNIIQKGLRTQEAEIFGGGGDKAIRSSVIIRTTHPELAISTAILPKADYKVMAKGKERTINLLEYLAYGTYDWDKEKRINVFNRTYFTNDQNFNLTITYPLTFQSDVLKALFLMTLFGGIGSRNRNGYGCLSIDSLQEKFEISNVVEFLKSLKKGERANFTAFSKNIKLFKTREPSKNWDGALTKLAEAYKSARESLDNPHYGNNRQYVSSPSMIDNKNKSFLERHAKPYFLSVTKNSEGSCDGWILFLPYNFCNHLKLNNIPRNVLENYDKSLEKINNGMRNSLNTVIE